VLAHTFRQNAVLWMGKDAVPKLVLLERPKRNAPKRQKKERWFILI
jgi:hypothetical protein